MTRVMRPHTLGTFITQGVLDQVRVLVESVGRPDLLLELSRGAGALVDLLSYQGHPAPTGTRRSARSGGSSRPARISWCATTTVRVCAASSSLKVLAMGKRSPPRCAICRPVWVSSAATPTRPPTLASRENQVCSAMAVASGSRSGRRRRALSDSERAPTPGNSTSSDRSASGAPLPSTSVNTEPAHG